ncbi:hypothetical protein Taro_043824, partial [Colocasia esculenta]|nr:hypothetical protein [Colocasia esculenta]
MATEGVAAEVAPEKPVQEETGAAPLKLEKELSGNLTDSSVSEIDDKKVDLSDGTKIGDVVNIDCGALIRTANQSISEDPSGDSKSVQSIYLGNSGCSEGEDFTKSPLNIQVSLDEKISKCLNAGLDEGKPFEIGKEMVKSDTSCQNDNIGKMEKKDESTEREHYSEANEKDTCDATLARQRTGEWSSEREKEAKVQYEEALELASKQRIMGNNVEEVPPLAVKGLDCLNLQKEELGNEIAFSKDNPEVEACNNLEVFEINIEASNRHIDQKCEKVVHESAFTAERLVKDEEKKLEAYSYVESEGIGHTVSETAKDEYDTAQENEAEVHTSIFNPPTLQESPSNTHKDELCSYETDKASDMDQKKNVNILAHDIAMKKKHEDCSLLDDGTEEKNTVSDVKEKNKKSDELQEEQNASENISDSMASHVANRPSVEKKKKDTEEETIQMDGAIQQTGTGEEGTNNGFKLNIFLCANDETTITKVDSKDEKIGDGLNLVSENKQPETIEANDKILKSDKDAGEGIQNVHHFVSKTEGHLHNSQCSTEVALQNDEGQKVEVKELSESLPDERIVASTAMSKTKDETTIDRTTLTADTPDETDQCDEIVDELQSTSQGREENEFVTVIHLTEVEHERAQEVSSTSCKEVDVSTVEEKKKQSSSDIELYAQDISKTDKELDMETDKSQDRDLSEDHKLEDRNIIKSIDPERTKENTSVQGGETAESQEQSCDKNQEIITLDHDILNENTTDAIEFDTSSSAESTGEKCFLDKHQENEKTEAIPKIIHKKDKFYKEKDINEVDSMVDECKNLQGSDSHSEESLKQTGADCEPSRTETQQDVGLNNIRSSARERVNEGVPKSNTERCKDTEEANLVACEQKDGDDQKHDNHPKTMSLGDEAAEEHTYTEKEHIYNYKQPSCSKQEEETGSDKHREETGELMTGCQESSKIENLGEQTKNIHAKEEMRYDWTIIEESKKANDLTEEDKTQEDDPDRSNALLPITYESVRKTMEEEEDIMQKKVPGSDTQEAIHETTNTNMTIGTGCENDAKSPVQPQPTFERTEEDESISDGPLKEQSEPETDQEASSTVSKYVGRITDEDAQKKASPETELCAQDTSEDDREVTVQDDEISVPSEHLPFNEDITTLVGDEVLKVATDRKFETSVQSPEDECLLNESQEKEKVAATSEMIQEEDKSHKVMNLYEVDSHEKKCNMLPKDPQAEESSENIGPDYEQFQTDTQEDCELTIIESSERRALKSNAEHKEHIEGKDEGNSKADILIDETDRQMLDNHQEHLSLGDDAAGGGMYTEREHIYKEPKCSEVLEIISQECKGEGDKLEEEAGKQTLNNHERSKQDNSSEETKNSLTEDTKEVTVPKQDNKRADDVKVTNEGPMDDSNAHLNVTNESVEEVVKQTLNHQESAKQDNLSEETKNALTEDTKEDTVSEPENKETEDLKETYEKHMDDSNADLSVTNELVEKAVKQTLDNQESSKHDNWSEEAKNALTEETKEVKVPEMTKRTDNLKETNEEYTEVSNAHLSVTNESVEEAVKETLGNQESSKQDNLSEETKTALTKETKEVSVPNQENNRTDDLKETNEEYMDESDAHLSVTDELVEEAVKQTLDHPESSKEDKLSEKTKKEFTEDTKEVTDPEQENKRTDDIKLTNVKHMDGSSAHLNVTDEQVEEEGKQTLDNKESSKKDILSEETQNALIEETKVVTVSEQENKRTDDLMETKEEHTDESDDPLSVTNELDEEAIKQTLDNQESSKQGKLSEETQNVLPEETKEVTDPEQETKRTDDLKETNEEYTDESIAHLSVTDELVEEAVKQTLDNQESSEQDNLSRETKNALTEETKEVTVPVQENKSTDDLKEANEVHMDERDAHLDVTNELVGEAVKQTLNNQESSKQVNLSEETENELIEESKEVTVPKQQNMSTDDLKETNVHTDERNTHLNATDELVREAVKQTLDNQENCKQDNLSEETDDAPIEETKEVIVPKQENKRTDDIKVTIEEHMDGNNAHLNVINELVEVAGKQALDNQETSKQDNLSGETKNAHTEQTNVVIIPEQENKGTSDLKETNEEHMDLSTAHLCVTDELVEEADKQTLDNEENSKQDILCEETKNTFTEESKEVTVPEQKHKGIDDLKETNEEHTDEGNFVTDELLEEAIKQTPNNQESSKQDNLSEETKNALTKETKEVTASEQEVGDMKSNFTELQFLFIVFHSLLLKARTLTQNLNIELRKSSTYRSETSMDFQYGTKPQHPP